MKTTKEVLSNFRQQSLIIDTNNSLGGGEKGKDAFDKTLLEALTKIEALMEEVVGKDVPEGEYTTEPIERMRQQEARAVNRKLSEIRHRLSRVMRGGEDE